MGKRRGRNPRRGEGSHRPVRREVAAPLAHVPASLMAVRLTLPEPDLPVRSCRHLPAGQVLRVVDPGLPRPDYRAALYLVGTQGLWPRAEEVCDLTAQQEVADEAALLHQVMTAVVERMLAGEEPDHA